MLKDEVTITERRGGKHKVMRRSLTTMLCKTTMQLRENRGKRKATRRALDIETKLIQEREGNITKGKQ